MTGVILAGGEGTRLRPLTYVANKHLLPVYDKPMIYYPIETLKSHGMTDIIIVSGGENIGGFAELLEDGSELGVNLTYRVQVGVGGIAHALGCVEGLVEGNFTVILGDNYFEEVPLKPYPSIYLKAVSDAKRFGVYDEEKNRIIEKPSKPSSNLAVTGIYVYDQRVFDVIKGLKLSARGELEITDVNNWYLENNCGVVEVSGVWSDMGTFESLYRAAKFVRRNE